MHEEQWVFMRYNEYAYGAGTKYEVQWAKTSEQKDQSIRPGESF